MLERQCPGQCIPRFQTPDVGVLESIVMLSANLADNFDGVSPITWGNLRTRLVLIMRYSYFLDLY